jgi:hypothetical protein
MHPLPATPAVPLGKGDKSMKVRFKKTDRLHVSLIIPTESFPSFSRRGGSAKRRRGGVVRLGR